MYYGMNGRSSFCGRYSTVAFYCTQLWDTVPLREFLVLYCTTDTVETLFYYVPVFYLIKCTPFCCICAVERFNHSETFSGSGHF